MSHRLLLIVCLCLIEGGCCGTSRGSMVALCAGASGCLACLCVSIGDGIARRFEGERECVFLCRYTRN